MYTELSHFYYTTRHMYYYQKTTPQSNMSDNRSIQQTNQAMEAIFESTLEIPRPVEQDPPDGLVLDNDAIVVGANDEKTKTFFTNLANFALTKVERYERYSGRLGRIGFGLPSVPVYSNDQRRVIKIKPHRRQEKRYYNIRNRGFVDSVEVTLDAQFCFSEVKSLALDTPLLVCETYVYYTIDATVRGEGDDVKQVYTGSFITSGYKPPQWVISHYLVEAANY